MPSASLSPTVFDGFKSQFKVYRVRIGEFQLWDDFKIELSLDNAASSTLSPFLLLPTFAPDQRQNALSLLSTRGQCTVVAGNLYLKVIDMYKMVALLR
jgi:hypothetical protein